MNKAANYKSNSSTYTSSEFVQEVKQDFRIKLRSKKLNNFFNKQRQKYTTSLSQQTNPIKSLDVLCNEYKQAFEYQNIKELTKLTYLLRTEISKDNKQSEIEFIIKEGIAGHVMNILNKCNNICNKLDEKLVIETEWLLQNLCISSKRQNFLDQDFFIEKIFVNNNGVNLIFTLLQSINEDVITAALASLSNITANSKSLRNKFLELNIQKTFSYLFQQWLQNEKIYKKLAWCISNFINERDFPKFDQIKLMIVILFNLIQQQPENESILSDVLWSISSIVVQSDEILKEFFQLDQDNFIINHIIQIALSEKFEKKNNIIYPAIKCLSSIVGATDADDKIVSWVLDNKYLKVVQKHIFHFNNQIKQEICFSLSNIAACKRKIQLKLLTEDMVMNQVAKYAVTESTGIRKECIYTLCNLCTKAGRESAKILVQDFNCLEPLIIGLDDFYNNSKIIRAILYAIKNLFYCGSQISGLTFNFIVKKFYETGGAGNLEKVLKHKNSKVYELCDQIIDKYFTSDEDEENEEDHWSNHPDIKLKVENAEWTNMLNSNVLEHREQNPS